MVYEETHPRKIIGESVHDTMEEAREKQQLFQTATEKRWHKGMAERMAERMEKEREEIEATYLIPEVENFVETPQIKSLKERIKLWLSQGFPVHIIGPTGCGKTTLAMQVGKELGQPVVWINGDEQVTTTDLIGGYSQVEVESLRDRFIHNVFKSRDILKADWVDNPLTLACKYGYVLVYNEFSRTLPAANNVLLSVFEEKILELPTKFGEERYINVNPNFAAIFTSNSIEYAGIHRPQDALLDRMIGVYMDYYDFDTEVEIVKAHTGMPTEEAKKVVSVIRALRNKFEGAEKPGTRACILLAKGLQALNGYTKENFEQLCVDVIATKTKGPMDLSNKTKIIKEVLKGV